MFQKNLFFVFLFFVFSFFVGEENFLKEAFLPPHPHLSRTFKLGRFFIFHFVR